jgi:Flp pilus assembly protein TadD
MFELFAAPWRRYEVHVRAWQHYFRRVSLVLLPVLTVACQSQTAMNGDLATQEPVKTNPQLDRSLFDAAESSERKRDFITASTYYRSLYARNPNDVEAVVGLSRSLRRLGQVNEAQAILRRAMASNKDQPALMAEMGKVRLALGGSTEAVELLSRAHALGMRSWDVETALAVAYDRLGMYDDAERRYQSALAATPENAVVLNNYGLSRAQAGRLEEATDLLERAIALPEATSKMRQNLALFHAMRGNMARAEALVRKDLSGEDADVNLAYLRRLQASIAAGGAGMPMNDGAGNRPVAAGNPMPAVSGANTADVSTKAPDVATAERTAAPTEEAGKVLEKAPDDGDKANAAPTPVDAQSNPASSDSARAQDKPVEPSVKPATDTAAPTAAVADAPKLPIAPSAAADPTVPSKASADGAAAADKVETAMPAADQPTSAASGSEPSTVQADDVPKKVASVPPAIAESFRLQLGSFSEDERARNLIERVMRENGELLAGIGFDVAPFELEGKGTFYRVLSDPISGRDWGDAICAALRIKEFPCLLVAAK